MWSVESVVDITLYHICTRKNVHLASLFIRLPTFPFSISLRSHSSMIISVNEPCADKNLIIYVKSRSVNLSGTYLEHQSFFRWSCDQNFSIQFLRRVHRSSSCAFLTLGFFSAHEGPRTSVSSWAGLWLVQSPSGTHVTTILLGRLPRDRSVTSGKWPVLPEIVKLNGTQRTIWLI